MNELVKLHKCKLTETALVIQKDISFDEWMQIGAFLKQVNKCVLWWLGDWLNFGEHKYGEKYSQALDETDYSYSGLSNAAWVANKIETSRRRENLSWSHHAEVAGLSEEKQDIFLGKSFDNKLSVMGLRKEIQREKHSIKDIPTKNFDIVLIDPPWRFDNYVPSRAIENHYPTLDLDDLKTIQLPISKDAVLFMWATSPILDQAINLMMYWGFEYKTTAIWDKEIIGCGYWFRNQHEFILLGIKGDIETPKPENRFPSVIDKRRLRHSEKPKIHDLIEAMFPKKKYIEMFARQPVNERWEVWGNELG